MNVVGKVHRICFAAVEGKTVLRSIAQRGSVFVLVAWLASRALVALGIFAIAHAHLGAMANWDGIFYRKIATSGYTYVPDGGFNTVAFFPLYPLVVRLLMTTGLSFETTGVAVSNASFLLMLWVAFGWIRDRAGIVAARWCVAVLAFFPMSVFCSVAYAESLFMLLSALALRDFDRERYGRAAVWTALASLTRPTGLWLLPAFAVAALADRRKPLAFLCSLAAATGGVVFATYCAISFGDAFAQVHAEQYFRGVEQAGFGSLAALLAGGLYSFDHWKFQLQLIPIVLPIFFYKRLPAWLTLFLCATAVYVEHWCWDRDFGTAVLLFVGAPALWYFRKSLGTAAVAYGIVSIVTLLVTGTSLSIDRFLYATLALPIAMGLLFARLPSLGVPMLAAFCYDLVISAAKFAQNLWVA